MSPKIRVLWIVIGCMFVLGVALTVTGFALGASGTAWFDRGGLHFGTRDMQRTELSDNATEDFERIDVRLLEADVEIVTANSYGYEFSYLGRNEPTIEVRNGTLTVVEQEGNWRINLFGFFGFFDSSAQLRIFVPSEAELDEVKLSTASGETLLSSNEIRIESLICESASGDITLSNLDLGTLNLDVASGDVELSNVAADSAKINIISGRLNYSNANLGSLELDMASGNVKLDGEITELLQVRMVSGDADIVLTGSLEDYSYSVKKISGDIRINGHEVDGNSFLPGTSSSGSSGGGHIEIDTVSGSVKIDFR